MFISFIILVILTIVSISLSVFIFFIKKQSTRKLEQREKTLEHKFFELAVLKELDERIGYSLNIQKIIDVIIGSLKQLIDYTAVSYLLFEQDHLIFKCHLEKSVADNFIQEIKNRMLESLAVILNFDLKKHRIDQTISGAIIIDEIKEPVRSFFNIPLTIGQKTVGLITVASTEKDVYQEEEMTVLYKIAGQASRAVSRLEEVLTIEKEKSNALVESIIDGIIMIDKNYKILIVNPAVKNILGLAPGAEVSIFNLIDKFSGVLDVKGKLEEVINLEKIITQENAFINDRFYKIIMAPVKSDLFVLDNKILGAVVIFHDITRECELEKVREDFTHMIVHELRSPLDGLKKMSEVLSNKKNKIAKKERDEFFSLIFKNSNDMLVLVNDLLDAAKIEAGKFQIAKQEASNIGSLILEKVKYFESQAELEKIKMQIKIASGLPKISIDHLRISQILNNLIGNALKYTEKDGRIEIGAFLHQAKGDILKEAKGAGLVWQIPANFASIGDSQQQQNALPLSIIISVTDTGIGMAPGEQELLFNKYRQLKASLEGGKRGAGLGLVIAKGIIESHGGRIFILSEPGQGSTFYFNLPV